MSEKNIIKLTESELKNVISESVKKVLAEGFLSKMGGKIKNGMQTLKDKWEDELQGFETKEGNPTSIEDVFEGDGWQVAKVFSEEGSTYYYVKPVLGQGFGHDGVPAEEMVEELEIFLNGKAKVSYEGTHPKYSYIEMFKIDF